MSWRKHFALVCLGVGVVAQGCAQVLGFGEQPDFGLPCTTPVDCPGRDDACNTRICVSGTCGMDFAVAGKPCDGTNFCDGAGSCKLGPGLGCLMDTQCFTGFCVDGMCCDKACALPCEDCSSDKGVCTPFAKDTDPEDECNNGVCNGASACVSDNGEACTAGETCRSGFCVEGMCCNAACDTTNYEQCVQGQCEDVRWAQWTIPKDQPEPSSDYEIDAAKDIVVDKVTKLMWQRTLDAQSFTWAAAKDHCDKLVHAGYDDWRLPTRIELVSIVDYTKIEPAIDVGLFPATPAEPFWTSSAWTGSAVDAWHVNFFAGDVRPFGGAQPYWVRCVR